MNPEVSTGGSPTATPRVSRCACGPMHPGIPKRERPEAHVVMYANPCQTEGCEGRLICAGHAACVECIAAIRANRCGWAADDADVTLYAITSSGVSS